MMISPHVLCIVDEVCHSRLQPALKKFNFVTAKHFHFLKQRVDHLTHMGKELHDIDDVFCNRKNMMAIKEILTF